MISLIFLIQIFQIPAHRFNWTVMSRTLLSGDYFNLCEYNHHQKTVKKVLLEYANEFLVNTASVIHEGSIINLDIIESDVIRLANVLIKWQFKSI